MKYAAACERIFLIPELLVLVCSYLTKREILRLMVVSRNLHDVFFPVFYEHLNLRQSSVILLNRTTFKSLIMSAPHVRKLILDDEFLVMYSKGVVAFKKGITADGDPCSMAAMPLSPMDQLSGLTYVSSNSLNPDVHTDDQYRRVGRNFIRFCWVTEISPLLTRLSAGLLFISNNHEPGALARTIGGLVHLRELKLNVVCSEALWSKLILGITRHCPPLVQEIQLVWTQVKFNHPNLLALVELDEIDRDESPLPMPLEPLEHLTTLDLEGGQYYRSQDICPLLERCPRLTTLHPPPSAALDQILTATFISQYCPRLRRIYRRKGNKEPYGSSTFGVIVSTIPRNTLQHLLIGTNTGNDTHLCSLIPNHYESLTSVKFLGCRVLDRPTILGILRNCAALEEFLVQGFDDYLWDASITIEEGAEKPWASNRIRVLELAVDFGVMNEFTYPKPPEEPSRRQLERRKQLENFYRRIAAQHLMTDLCLKVADKPQQPGGRGKHYNQFSLSSMLILQLYHNPPYTQRTGYLALFSEMNQLRTLSGSFCALTFRRHNLITTAEADWVRKHWPKFQSGYIGRLEAIAPESSVFNKRPII
ncbi:hypothetical protein BG015_008269 [Linnemannia schmuckeri]|uniref:F-box domain-containing protein n=1 Tax=Linnemannia schmuckeri TaxID=64567 RepID=A0A9P5VAG2_9FUNG|nr:hypothetical protein BG015_008269 [Linnemannia schmuckeri]